MIKNDPIFEAASNEFDRLVRENKRRVSLRLVAKRHGISAAALANYRANYISRIKSERKTR